MFYLFLFFFNKTYCFVLNTCDHSAATFWMLIGQQTWPVDSYTGNWHNLWSVTRLQCQWFVTALTVYRFSNQFRWNLCNQRAPLDRWIHTHFSYFSHFFNRFSVHKIWMQILLKVDDWFKSSLHYESFHIIVMLDLACLEIFEMSKVFSAWAQTLLMLVLDSQNELQISRNTNSFGRLIRLFDCLL